MLNQNALTVFYCFLGSVDRFLENEVTKKVVEYNIIKFCRICRVRFVVKRGDSKKMYCDKCQSKVAKGDSPWR